VPHIPSFGDRIGSATVPAVALLPIRFFYGVTFLYAGFDKLLDPRFLDPASPASIQAQMAGFARGSPVGDLVRLGQPYAVEIGFLIAIAEIAIGLGALTGLAFRIAALGGAVLSILFWLTVSWTTHPFYLGADLPYAIGWIALALAGPGRLLVPSWPREDQAPVSAGRRALLQTGVLAVLALMAGSLAVPLRLAGLERTEDPSGVGGSGTPGGSPASSGAGPPVPTPGDSAAPVGRGIPIAKVADVERRGASAFTIPFDAPAPLAAGDPGVIVRLKDGTFVAFDAVCTHAGCTVEWEATNRVLVCPCHGAVFDPANHAAVLEGPTNQPLTSLPIVVDQATGSILLRTVA
jgi:thiosulfate dehydrogenase [quinone] large subunit